jgi:hypothetical protein
LLKIDVEMMYRRPQAPNYSFQAGIKRLQICKLLGIADPNKGIAWIYHHMANLTNGVLLHPCPYVPGHFAIKNFTTSIENYPFMSRGDYKLTVFARDDVVDPVGFNITLFYTLKIRGATFF